MRNIILFTALLFSSLIFSQNFICGVGDDLSYETLRVTLNNNNQRINQNNSFCDTIDRYVFNVNFHVVYKSDSTRVVPVGENEVLNAIKHLNNGYNQFNIFFKYRGIHKIIDDENDGNNLYNLDNNSMSWMHQTYSIPNSFNIYIIEGSVAGAAARAYIKNTHSYFKDIWFLDEWTICHEIGHNFGLAHPYNGQGNPYSCEHTTRDPGEIGIYNADTAGDLITDTHATSQSVQFSDIDCSMLNNPGDCLVPSVPYITHSNDNYMFPSNSNGNPCPPTFTPKQGVRMVEVIIENNYNRFSDASSTLESLFEPFEVKDIPGNAIISVTPIDSEHAEVCRNILRQHKFQPGFNYSFTSTFLPDISTATQDQIPLIKYNTSEFGVKIDQVNPNCEITVPVICTRGVVCNVEPYVLGKITTTTDLGSTNFTIIELTEEQLKDPYYIEQLENNKYHIIKKETKSGAIYQVTIYKN